jgi:DNA-binding transcriptional regulator YiaG
MATPFARNRYLAKVSSEELIAELKARHEALGEKIQAVEGLELGAQIRAIRKRMKMTMVQFGAKIGYSIATVGMMETGHRPGTCRRVLEILQVDAKNTVK